MCKQDNYRNGTGIISGIAEKEKTAENIQESTVRLDGMKVLLVEEFSRCSEDFIKVLQGIINTYGIVKFK